jgi:uncharacterized Zn-binding protein involved in type VI secretion
MPAVARVSDPHVCPMTTGTVPHVGGPITGPGVPTVLVGDQPVAVSGDACICVGPPDAIAGASTRVLAGDKPIARQGDLTAHGGQIATGFPTVQAE